MRRLWGGAGVIFINSMASIGIACESIEVELTAIDKFGIAANTIILNLGNLFKPIKERLSTRLFTIKYIIP
jgi:hypothetical protein